MIEFIPSLDLNEQFYQGILRPLLEKEFPGLLHSAARLGAGSDVLGFDDEMSTDHDWGIRQQIFLREEDYDQWATAVSEILTHKLPATYRGYSVHFGPPDEDGTQLLVATEDGPVNHRIELVTTRGFFKVQLGIDPIHDWDTVAWILVSQQCLLQVTKGRVFGDDLNELVPLRQKLTYFPDDVWLYLLACQWRRIGQEDHFVGRTGYRGDDIGSRLLASRIVRDIMLLGFLYERQYAPYPKWYGTAFKRLVCAAELGPILQAVLTAVTWPEREEHLCRAFEVMGEIHNGLHLTPELPAGCEQFHTRPFRVHTGAYSDGLRAAITDEQVLALRPYIGSIDQFSDSTDLRSYPDLFARLRPLYSDNGL